MIEAFRAKIKNIDAQSWQLRAGLGALEQAIDGSPVDTLRERIGSLEAGAERLQVSVDQFMTEVEAGRTNEGIAGHAASVSEATASETDVGSSASSLPMRDREGQAPRGRLEVGALKCGTGCAGATRGRRQDVTPSRCGLAVLVSSVCAAVRATPVSRLSSC